ncbi:hypothetical protein [Salipiger abyssi]|uniref:hypothetical protein n=1 Tax=Salipiger abyssi TaxID=1250539 RepID=UPI001A8DB8A4|nr:hypothetical protein [Salipiger abyssi]MBN9887793.1 hypothetical protein [Salipiger abyssi]
MSNIWIFLLGTLIIFSIAILATSLLFLKLFAHSSAPLPSSASIENAREWIGATSGWFAGFVAIIAVLASVLMISRQISSASDQHLELMKFQAHEKLVLATQVQTAASGAHGTIVQLHDSVINRDDELTDGKLHNDLAAARSVSKLLSDTGLSDKAYQLFGHRSAFGSFEAALDDWIAKAMLMLRTSVEPETGETRRQMLKRLSGALVILEIELRHTQSEARDFIKIWGHLTP